MLSPESASLIGSHILRKHWVWSSMEVMAHKSWLFEVMSSAQDSELFVFVLFL